MSDVSNYSDSNSDSESNHSDSDSETEAGTENDKKTIKVFKVFYSCYPGTKRSPETEYENFMKQNRKNKDKIIHLLLPALEKEKQFRMTDHALYIYGVCNRCEG